MSSPLRPIRVLPEEVSRLIAAGEVVSRPLDVVRELVENALDAGASRIEVEVEGGGLGRITVRDNGAGIPAESVPLAPVRHATSKLPDAAVGGEGTEGDGLKGEGAGARPSGALSVSTLGFRGEALWAAAQAGALHLVTRPATQVGATEVWARGESLRLGRTAAPAGTAVTVRDLFADLPARRRTQAPPATELREITALLGRYVLHHPGLSWRLEAEGETRLLHAPSDTRGAVATVYGPLSANRLLGVGAGGVWGAVSRPELTRARRDRMHFAVGGRPVLAPELERAVIAAYTELLPSGAAPLCVLNLDLSPDEVNPNVHPAKQVVAFADPEGVAAQVREAVAQALAAQPLTRSVPALRVPGGGEPGPDLALPEGNAGAAPPARAGGALPTLTFLGVYQALYLLAQGEGDLWVVDAHAAHERCLYERLGRDLAGQSVELPHPELLHLTPEQLARLHERGPELRAWGLDLEEFGAGLARLRSLPASLAALGAPRLHELIVDTALGHGEDPRRAVLARLACLPALRAGHVEPEHGQALLDSLAACEQPWACPHGRPTVLRLSERDLAHAFGRRGVRDVERGRDLAGGRDLEQNNGVPEEQRA